MLTERELLETIEECRTSRPTASTCQLMASCYTILDHLFPAETTHAEAPKTQQREPTAETAQSEFAKAARNAGAERLINVMDKHMECVRALYPKEYNAVMQMLLTLESS